MPVFSFINNLLYKDKIIPSTWYSISNIDARIIPKKHFLFYVEIYNEQDLRNIFKIIKDIHLLNNTKIDIKIVILQNIEVIKLEIKKNTQD